jgi:alkanesulfonate monooxygenase SsuD/methylene tetrahydromethanopterin reductase-like flavin-dependent oxidoreductase (luciferase family)
MRALWAEPHAEYHGEFVDFPKVTCSPRPVKGNIPIIVGGDSDAALDRAVRIADGYFPGEGDHARLKALLARLRQTAERAGRDPASIAINTMFGIQMANPAAGVEQMASLGVDRIMVPAFFFAGPGGIDRLRAFAGQVMPLARAA